MNSANEPPLLAAKFPRVSFNDESTSFAILVSEHSSDAESHNTCCVYFAPFKGDNEAEDWVQCACKK